MDEKNPLVDSDAAWSESARMGIIDDLFQKTTALISIRESISKLNERIKRQMKIIEQSEASVRYQTEELENLKRSLSEKTDEENKASLALLRAFKLPPKE